MNAANEKVLQIWKRQQWNGLILHRFQNTHQSGLRSTLGFIDFGFQRSHLVASITARSIVDTMKSLQNFKGFGIASLRQQELGTLREKEERDSSQQSRNGVQNEQQSPRFVGDRIRDGEAPVVRQR